MSRRNEGVYGTKAIIDKQALALTGDDAKTFHAAIIEYSKDQPKVLCSHCLLTVLLDISVYTFVITYNNMSK